MAERLSARPWRRTLLFCGAAVAAATFQVSAADQWFEFRSAHFTVWSNAGDGNTRTLLWQLEQVRSAIAVVWPWAKVDLPKQMLVLGVKDENTVRALAPRYWEQPGGVRPVSVWVTGPDRHYIMIRADLRGDDRDTVNPHTHAYFAYANLVLDASFHRDLPFWFQRGLAGVLSNTIVRESYILLSPPIPRHLQELRNGARLRLDKLITLTNASPELQDGTARWRFDAQSWAFVHYLMFGEKGAHQARVNELATLLRAGKDPAAAFVEALGRAEDYEGGFNNYINRNVFGYRKLIVDAAVEREKFAARPIPPAEAAAGQALFHVAMRRQDEAKRLIEEARRLDGKVPAADVAEAIQFDIAGRDEEARAAYARAVELGSSDAYAHYRYAVLSWGPQPERETLMSIEKSLARAVEINPFLASAHAALGEARAALDQPADVVNKSIGRAIQLEPSSEWHRLSSARVLLRFQKYEAARAAAQTALALSLSDAARGQSEELLSTIHRNQERAAAALEQRCGGGQPESCVQLAELLISRNPPDAARARELLTKSCEGGFARACELLKSVQK